MKWQLIKTDLMVQAYHTTLEFYRRLAPMQEKMFRHMEREIEDMDEADRWKIDEPESPDDPEAPETPPGWR